MVTCNLNTRPQEQAIVHEQFLSSIKTPNFTPGEHNGESKKREPKDRSSNFKAVVGDKKSTNQCPLQDGIHRLWQYEAFKKKSPDVC